MMILLALMLCASAALAETWEIEQDGLVRYQAETFTDTVPGKLGEAFRASAFGADRVLGGASLTQLRKSGGVYEQFALMAVEHQGKPLLLGAGSQDGAAWELWAESAIFLRDGADFVITVKQPPLEGNSKHPDGTAFLAVDYGGDAFLLSPVWSIQAYASVIATRWFEVYGYVRLDENGDGIAITCRNAGMPWIVREYRGGTAKEIAQHAVRWPVISEYIDGDTFPRSAQELAEWAAANPINTDGHWMVGANFRKKGSSSSQSQGQYIYAPLTVLDSKSGATYPWYKVKLAGVDGWVSGPYVSNMPEASETNHDLAQVSPLPVARAKQSAKLYSQPGKQAVQELNAGTTMRVMGVRDDWYHVLIPNEAEAWQTDVPGEYGYVRKEDVGLYTTWLRMEIANP